MSHGFSLRVRPSTFVLKMVKQGGAVCPKKLPIIGSFPTNAKGIGLKLAIYPFDHCS